MKDTAVQLKSFAEEIARRYSMFDREKNFNKETFEVDEIYPSSDSTAIIAFKKNTGKKAVAFCYYLKGKWQYFFPTDSHVVGMLAFAQHKLEIERGNFEFNFVRREPANGGRIEWVDDDIPF